MTWLVPDLTNITNMFLSFAPSWVSLEIFILGNLLVLTLLVVFGQRLWDWILGIAHFWHSDTKADLDRKIK